MLKVWAYVKNITDAPRRMRHPLLKSAGGWVSCAPGGLTPCDGMTLTLEPGQVAKLPNQVFFEVANKLPWTLEVQEEEFLKAAGLFAGEDEGEDVPEGVGGEEDDADVACDFCDFVARNKTGLAAHRRARHPGEG